MAKKQHQQQCGGGAELIALRRNGINLQWNGIQLFEQQIFPSNLQRFPLTDLEVLFLGATFL